MQQTINTKQETILLTQLKSIWTDNAGLVQLLGLCPLLAVTNTVVNGLVLGVATLFVVLLSGILVSLSRDMISREVRLPIFVIIIGGLVGAIDLLLETYFYTTHHTIGLFIPLIVTNCVIIARAESFASKHAVIPAALDGLLTGIGFLITLLLLGGIRELVGNGTLFEGIGLLFGLTNNAPHLTLPGYAGFIPMLLPTGAFFACALLIAIHNTLSKE